MSYEFYRALHVIAILMVFLSLGGAIMRATLNDTSAAAKKMVMMVHGTGLLLAILAGFGALAKAGIPFGGWVAVKFVIWLILGGAVAMVGRLGNKANMMWYVIIILGAVAAYMAIFKPF